MGISADIGLETPQIVLSWDYASALPELESLELRRSLHRFPESMTDGDSILSEVADNADLRISYADTSVAADSVYYYSLFFKHKGPFSANRVLSQDIERLGKLRSIFLNHQWADSEVIGVGDGGTATYAGNLRSHVKPRSVIISTVVSGSPVLVTDDGTGGLVGDVGVGTNTIDYESGAYDVTFSGNVDNTEDINASYGYGSTSYWVLARDDDNVPVLWAYNSRSKLCDERIDLSAILASTEELRAVVDYDCDSADRTFELITNKRYIEIEVAVTADEATTDDIVSEWVLAGRLSPGFEVAGACKEFTTGPTINGIRILDSSNLEAKLFSTTGTLVRTMDLSSVIDGSFRGCAYDEDNDQLLLGAGKLVVALDTTDTAPDNTDIEQIIPVREPLSADFTKERSFLALVNSDIGVLERFDFTDLSGSWQMEEGTSPGPGVEGLWRLDDSTGDAIDISGNAYDGTVSGTITRGATGKFSYAYEIADVDGLVSLPCGAGFLEASGYFSFWWKRPYSGYLPPVGTRILVSLKADVNNYFTLQVTAAGNLELAVAKGGTTTTLSAAIPSALSDDLFAHILVTWVTGSATVYVNGSSHATSAIGGSWAGTPTLYIGDASAASLGSYCDLAFGSDTKSHFTRYSVTTLGNRAHAFSGRDPSSLVTNFRDKLFSYFGEFIIRNDYEQVQLPADRVLPTEEVIFRQDKEELVLGHLGALARLFGLFLDRVVDKRRFFMNHLKLSRVEYEFIEDLGQLINATDFDEDWNVDKMRRFLQVTWDTFQRGGTVDSFARMARFLGFRLWAPDGVIPFKLTRRRFDSCINPARVCVPLDTGHLDSSDSSFHLSEVLFRLYKESFVGSNGATSAPASRTFTDTTANFLVTAAVGSMLKIYDVDDGDDDGEYLVTAVTPFTLTVERDWPVGSKSSLAYSLHWRVPNADPYVSMVLSRFTTFKARWQKLTADPDIL